MGPEDPLRVRATELGAADGWRGARIGAEIRDRSRRSALRMPVEVDIGEPKVPVVTSLFLLAAIATTLWEFNTYGVSPAARDLARAGGTSLGAIATGEWWKLLAANLLHGDLLHVGLNVFFALLVGRQLEHLVGRTVVVATVAWSMLLSSLLAIVLGGGAVSVGASGVGFGLMGCALAADPRGRTAVGFIARPLLLVNVLYTFIGPNISVGGHLGGLLAGMLVGMACFSRRATEAHPAGRRRLGAATVAVALAAPIMLTLAAGPERVPFGTRWLQANIVAPMLANELDGAQLSNGVVLTDATCRSTVDLDRYRCKVEHDGIGEAVEVQFSPRIDRWAIQGVQDLRETI